MLSPTLALRCPQCQHAHTLDELRTSPNCPQCAAPHGLPGHVVDSLALYERAIQQAVTDLMGGLGGPRSGLTSGPAAPAAPAPATSPRASVLTAGPSPAPAAAPDGPAPAGGAPVPATSPRTSLLAAGPAPAPAADGAPVPATSPRTSLLAAGPAPVAGDAATDSPVPATSQAPSPAAGPAPAPTSGPPAASGSPVPAASPATSGPSPAGAGAPVLTTSPVSATDPPGPAPVLSNSLPDTERAAALEASPAGAASTPSTRVLAGQAPPISTPPTALSLEASARGFGDLETSSGSRTPAASNSSLFALLSARSSPGLADIPLPVAAVREPAPSDTQPARPTSDLAAAVRRFLPDRPGGEPEPEGRIPAAALAVARRALLTRHAEERRQQQVREGNLGLFVAAVVCTFLLVAGLWYVAAPLAVVALVLRLRREERSERFGAEVQRLADALGGQRLSAYEAITAWFDALWPAPVSPEAMWTSHLHGAVRCQVHGYAALLDVHLNEKTSAGTVFPPRITAYLAAAWPGRIPSLRMTATDLPASAQARLARLRKAGYTVVADAHGGLIMRVSEAIAESARQDITRLPALQVPIGELAALAEELGAEPVSAP